MSIVSEPVDAAGTNPIDLTAWKARLARREQKANPPLSPVIQIEPQGDEADWHEWYQRTAENRPTTNDEIRAMAVAKRKKIAPGSMEQHDAFIREHDGHKFAEYIRAYRQRAIFGVWPDGSKHGPGLPACTTEEAKFLSGQENPTKYLSWLRKQDPERHRKFIETHPSYRSQVGLSPLAKELATVSTSY